MRRLVENIFPKYALIGSILGNLTLIFLSPFAAYAKRCAVVWKIPERIDFHKTIRNKRGSARRKLERQLAKENVL